MVALFRFFVRVRMKKARCVGAVLACTHQADVQEGCDTHCGPGGGETLMRRLPCVCV